MRRRRGASAIEFALGFPVLLVILFGVMDWSWYLTHQLTATRAAHRGARIAAGVSAADNPELLAITEARAWLDAHALNGSGAIIDAAVQQPPGDSELVLRVSVRAPLEPLVGLLPVPELLVGEATVTWYGEP